MTPVTPRGAAEGAAPAERSAVDRMRGRAHRERNVSLYVANGPADCSFG